MFSNSTEQLYVEQKWIIQKLWVMNYYIVEISN